MNQTPINTTTDGRPEICIDCGKEYLFIPIIWDDREYLADRDRICDQCQKIRQEKIDNEEKEFAQKQADYQRDSSWRQLCPTSYRKTDPLRLPQDRLEEVMKWQYNPQGILLYGKTGGYKTRTAYLLLHRLHYEGIKIAAFDSTDFVNMCADKFCEGKGGAWIESLIRIQLLFLDDLGNEPSGERGAGELFHVIKRRAEEELPVIITTNSVGTELAGKLRGPEDRGSALVRRLREFCTPIAF